MRCYLFRYNLNCNVNRSSSAIIVHYVRAFFNLKIFSFLAIPNQGSTCYQPSRQVANQQYE